MKIRGWIRRAIRLVVVKLQQDEYNWSDDSKKCYDLAIKALREKHIRSGRIAPRTEAEHEQALQGPVKPSQLDCVR